MVAWKEVARYAGVSLVLAFVGLVYWSAPAEREEICSVRLEASVVGGDSSAITLTATLRKGDSGLRSDRCTERADPPGPVEVMWRPEGGDWRTLVLDEAAQEHAEGGAWQVEVVAPACGRIELELRVHADGGWSLAHDAVDVAC